MMPNDEPEVPLEVELRRYRAAEICEATLTLMYQDAHGVFNDYDTDAGEHLRDHVEAMAREDLEDAFVMLAEIVVTKQWTLHAVRLDCDCDPCQESKREVERDG